MKFPDLSKLGLRCACGEEIAVESWEDQSDRSRVFCMRVHGQQYAQRATFYDLYGAANDDHGLVLNLLHRGEHALRRDCPSRQPSPLNELGTVTACNFEMIEVRMPDGSIQRRMGRVTGRLSVPFLPYVPEPVKHPTFGKPTVRKILT